MQIRSNLASGNISNSPDVFASEAKQSTADITLDCFASLAKTRTGENVLRVFRLILSAFLCIATTSSFAHHSYVAEFDADSPATIEGVVKEVWFKNPHVRYYIAVIDEDGEEVVYDTRGLTPVKLVRQGWTKKTIQVGDRLKVHGHLGHTNKHIMSILDITLEDGTVLTSRSVAYDIKDVKE